jgi:hypothetical protein
MNQPARRKTDADATGDESISRDLHILWKTFKLSSERRYSTPLIGRNPENYGLILPIHSQAARLHGGFADV